MKQSGRPLAIKDEMQRECNSGRITGNTEESSRLIWLLLPFDPSLHYLHSMISLLLADRLGWRVVEKSNLSARVHSVFMCVCECLFVWE